MEQSDFFNFSMFDTRHRALNSCKQSKGTLVPMLMGSVHAEKLSAFQGVKQKTPKSAGMFKLQATAEVDQPFGTVDYRTRSTTSTVIAATTSKQIYTGRRNTY